MHRYKEEASNLIKLATPVLIASIAQTGMSFVDTVMAGGVSAIDMAAVSIAASIWLPSILFGVGSFRFQLLEFSSKLKPFCN